jgi:CDP-paratose 2-epimerase
MNHKRIIIPGGAGFVGSSYAIWLARRHEGLSITVVDNLKRRGSELNISRLREHGIEFVHGDIRSPEDLQLDDRNPDLIVDCSAEPSVLAGYGAGSEYMIRTNLIGSVHCLELARRCGADVVFLSTSRVYPIAPLNRIAYTESEDRYDIAEEQEIAGVSREGISEAFPLEGVRTLYGATKLGSELLASEYADMYRLRTIINRCGVIAGPWQMGKVDQGVIALWMAAHRYRRPLAYVGWGGEGKQVRDVLYIDDLCELLDIQLSRIDTLSGTIFNAGGGPSAAISLREMTRVCERISGNRLEIRSDPQTRPGDIRIYVTDNSSVQAQTGWQPRHSAEETLAAIDRWMSENESLVKPLFTQ